MTKIEVRTAEEWEATITSEVVSLGVISTPHDFSASLERRDFGRSIRITRVRSEANVIRRSASHISSSDDGFAILHMNLRGKITVQQHGRTCNLQGLGATIYTTDKPSVFDMSSDYDGLLLQMPRQLLATTMGQLQQKLVQPIATDQALFRILLSMLSESHENTPDNSAEKEVIAQVAVDLVTGILTVRRDVATNEPAPLLTTMLQLVERSFNDPDLTVASIARKMKVSERVVYRAFSKANQSPATLIRSKRLVRAMALLQNSNETVYLIADASGFSDYSSFSRAFRREIGCSPTEWRKLHFRP